MSMTPIERLRKVLESSESAVGKKAESDCCVERKDLALALAVVDAAQARFEEWTRETYENLDRALSAITKEAPTP